MASEGYAGVHKGLFLCNNVRDIRFIIESHDGMASHHALKVTLLVQLSQGILLFPGCGVGRGSLLSPPCTDDSSFFTCVYLPVEF